MWVKREVEGKTCSGIASDTHKRREGRRGGSAGRYRGATMRASRREDEKAEGYRVAVGE